MAKGDIETYYENGEWKNRARGNTNASSAHDTKALAREKGRDLACNRAVEHVIEDRDGAIAEENTYPRSGDPRRTKG